MIATAAAGLLAALLNNGCARHGATSAAPPRPDDPGAATALAKPLPKASRPNRSSPARVDAFWARARHETYKSPAELAAQLAREARKGLRYDELWSGPRSERVAALTFDDGPHPDFTPQLLAILRRYRVEATFFVVGEMAEKVPELIHEERAAGHVIGNHTYHHVNLTKIPLDEIPIEWQACQDVVKAVTGETMRFCRPPGGDYDKDVIEAAMLLGLTTVLWTDDPGDYADPGDKVIETRVLDSVGNGAIILLHDGVQQTVDVLPQIIERLRARGFRFVTVEELRALATPRRGVFEARSDLTATGSRPSPTPTPMPLAHEHRLPRSLD